jgi:hypothetical protein
MRAPQIGFAQLVQDFFLRRLVAQRGASARTVEGTRRLVHQLEQLGHTVTLEPSG